MQREEQRYCHSILSFVFFFADNQTQGLVHDPMLLT
jgi:hypothetical protein